jgi:peptidyl-prolyl cis-trans isomerase D
MLAFFRAFAKSWAAKLLFGVLLIGFTVWGIQGGLVPHISTDVITAGQRHLSETEFRNMVDRKLAQARQEQGEVPPLDQLVKQGVPQQWANQLSQEYGFQAWLEQTGVKPDRSQTVEAMKEIQGLRPAFNPITGMFDEKAFRAILAQNQINEASFLQSLHDDLAQRDLMAAIHGGTVAPRLYTALETEAMMQTRDASYFALEAKSLGQPPQPTDADLQKLYKDFAAQLRRPESRSLTVAIFDPRLVASSVTINPADVQKTFDFRKDAYSVPEKRTFVQITAKTIKTAGQAAAALRAGQTPDAAAKAAGGQASSQADLAKSAVPDTHVADAVFALKPGQVSDAFQSDAGFAVIKLVSVTPGRPATLEDKRAEIEAGLREQAAKDKVQDMIQKYSEARDAGGDVAQAAAKVGAQVAELPPMTAEGQTFNGEQVKVPPQVLQKILGVGYSLPKGGQSDARALGGGIYFAVGVKDVRPPYTPAFAEVRNQLAQVWINRQVSTKLKAKSDELLARLKKGEPIAQVAASVGAKLEQGSDLQRSPPQANNLASIVSSMIFSAKQGEPFAYPLSPNVPVMIVGEVTGVHPPATIKAAEASTGRVQAGLGEVLARSLDQDARNAANEKVKPKVNIANVNAALGVSNDQGSGAPAQ